MKLVTKPQFDVENIKVGDAVRITVNGNFYASQIKTDIRCIKNGVNGLIDSVTPLKLSALIVDSEYVNIHVEDVAEGKIKITELVPKEC